MVNSLTYRYVDLPSTANVADAFREDEGLLVCSLGRRSACVPFFDIPRGYYALVTQQGRHVDYAGDSAIWPPGLYLAWSSLQVSHLVTQKTVVFDVPVEGCKTKDGVAVMIDCAVKLRIMGDESKQEDPYLVRTFVQEIGARDLEQRLRGALEEEVRMLASELIHANICGLFSTGVVPSFEETPPARGNAGDRGDWFTPMATPSPTYKMTASDAINSSPAIRVVECNLHCQEMKAKLNIKFQPQGVQITAVVMRRLEQEPPGG